MLRILFYKNFINDIVDNFTMILILVFTISIIKIIFKRYSTSINVFIVNLVFSLNRFELPYLFYAIKSRIVILATYCREQVLFTGSSQRTAVVMYHSYFGVQNPMRPRAYHDPRLWLFEVSFLRGVQ